MNDTWKMTLLFPTCVLLFCLPSLSHSTTAGQGDGQSKNENIERNHREKPSCTDYPSCELNLGVIRKAFQTRVFTEACRHANASYQCQKSATDDCKIKGILNAETLLKMKRAYVYAEIHKQEVCYSGSSPDDSITKGGLHCTEFRSCFLDVKKFKAAAENNLYHEACSIATRISKCAKSSISDCRRRNNLSAETLAVMQEMAMQALLRVDNFCALTTTTTAMTSSSRHETARCVDYANCPKPDLDVIQLAQRTKRYEEACNTMRPHAACIEATMTDCIKRGMVSGIILQSMKRSVAKANKEVIAFCPSHHDQMMDQGMPLSDAEPTAVDLTSVSPPRKHIKCSSIATCPRPRPALDTVRDPKQRDTEEYKNGCKHLKKHFACIEIATKDCDEHKTIPDDALKSMIQTVSDMKKILKMHCMQDGNPGNRGHTSGPQSLFYFVVLSFLISNFVFA